jgi:hypothetical protein
VANEDSVILKEVDQALEEDQTWEFFRKNGIALAAAAVLIVGGVAGWQFWGHMRTQTAERQALEFRNAVELLAENPDAGRAALEAVAVEKGGYGALAGLRRAASYAASGERLKALEIYRSIAAGNSPKRIRELAQLRAGYLALADGRDAVMSDLGNLAEESGPFSYYAREILGIASLQAEDYESAASTFSQLSLDIGSPDGVRERAEEFSALAAAGKAGVNIAGKTELDDLLNALGESQPAGDEAAGDVAAPVAPTAEEAASDASVEDEAAEDDHDDHNHEE